MQGHGKVVMGEGLLVVGGGRGLRGCLHGLPLSGFSFVPCMLWLCLGFTNRHHPLLPLVHTTVRLCKVHSVGGDIMTHTWLCPAKACLRFHKHPQAALLVPLAGDWQCLRGVLRWLAARLCACVLAAGVVFQ